MNKLILGVTVFLILISSCNPRNEISQSSQPIMKEVTITEPEQTVQSEEELGKKDPAESVKEFSITARRFEFNPSVITVDKGDRIRLLLRSTDVTHGFTIDEYNINEKLEPDKQEVVEFTADKSGEFTFYCSIPCGSGHGQMRGKLVVK